MNKQLLIVLILILIVLLVGGGLWWWLTQTTKTTPPPIIDPSQSFPVPPRLVVPPPTIPPTGSNTPTTTITNSPPPNVGQPNSRLTTLSERAVAGAIIISDKVIFLERETGLIVELNLVNREKKEIARVPLGPAAGGQINEAILISQPAKLSIWFSTGAGAEKNYFRGSLALSSTSENFILPEITPEPLEQNIKTLILSPDRDRIFTLIQVGEEIIGKVLDLKTNKSRLVFESKFNDWLAVWPEKNQIILTTKPTSQGAGAVYSLSLRNDKLERIIGGLNGLLTLTSPDGQKILYSRSAAFGLELGLYDRQKNTNRVLIISTLPEKCVWSEDSLIVYCASPRILPPATYPDDWLTGEVILDDLLWEINAATGLNRLIWSAEPGLGDAIKLQVANQRNKFIFTDRLTNRLYLIDELIP